MTIFLRSHQDEPRGLRTRQQIALSDEREDVLLKRAEREQKQQEVRHRKFDLLQRKVLLVVAVAISIAIILGTIGHPETLKLAIGAASVFGGLSAGLLRFRQGRVPPD